MIHYPVTRSTTGIGDQRERRAAADGETSDGSNCLRGSAWVNGLNSAWVNGLNEVDAKRARLELLARRAT